MSVTRPGILNLDALLSSPYLNSPCRALPCLVARLTTYPPVELQPAAGWRTRASRSQSALTIYLA